jgi:hypothetical protein
LEGSVEGVGGELGGVALGGREAADGGVDGVDVDESGVENGCAVDHLGDGGGCGLGCSTTLGVEGDVPDATVCDKKRDAREVSTGSPTRGARESAIDSRPTPALVAQVVLEELSFHAKKGKAPQPGALPPHTDAPSDSTRAHRAVTHTYLPCGCG